MPALNLNRTAFYGEIYRVGRRFLSRMPATNLNRAVFYSEVYGVDNKMCMILSVQFFFSALALFTALLESFFATIIGFGGISPF